MIWHFLCVPACREQFFNIKTIFVACSIISQRVSQNYFFFSQNSAKILCSRSLCSATLQHGDFLLLFFWPQVEVPPSPLYLQWATTSMHIFEEFKIKKVEKMQTKSISKLNLHLNFWNWQHCHFGIFLYTVLHISGAKYAARSNRGQNVSSAGKSKCALV